MLLELSDETLNAGKAEVFHLWEPSNRAMPSFAVADPQMSAAPLWRVSLHHDSPEHQQARFARVQQRLDLALATLPAAHQRLTALAEQMAPSAPDSLSFAPPDGAPESAHDLSDLAPPERQLVSALLGEEAVSFGLFDEVARYWQQAQQYVEQIIKSVQFYALVETEIQGNTVGHTAVRWSGDSETVWTATAGHHQRMIHQRALRLALASQARLLRVFALVVQGVIELSGLIALGGVGAVLAPARIYQFVERILAEAERK